MYDESAVGSGCADGGAGCERDVSEMLSRAKRWSRSASATRVVCNAELVNACKRSICKSRISLKTCHVNGIHTVYSRSFRRV